MIRQDIPTQTGLSTSILPAQNAGKGNQQRFEVSASWDDKIGELGYNLGSTILLQEILSTTAKLKESIHGRCNADIQLAERSGRSTWTGKFYDFADLENPDVQPAYPVYPGDLMFERT